MKITFPDKEQAKEAFANVMLNATIYQWDKKPKKYISVTPRCAEDKEQAKAMEKFLNHIWKKMMNIPEFRKQLAIKSTSGESFSKEELEGYFNKIIEDA